MDKDEEEMKGTDVDGAPPQKKKKLFKKTCHSSDIPQSPGSNNSTCYSVNVCIKYFKI